MIIWLMCRFHFTNQSRKNISNAFTCLLSKDNSFDTNSINMGDYTPFFSIQIKGYGVCKDMAMENVHIRHII